MHTPKYLLLTLACTLFACGGDGGGSSSGVDSGLPAERKGSELSDSEAKQLCEARAAYLSAKISEDDLKNFSCVLAGAFVGGENVDTCQMVYEACLEEEPMSADTGETAECALSFELSTCNATVAEIEACLTEQDNAYAEAITTATCADVSTDPGSASAGPACSKAQANCPGIFVSAGEA